MPDRAHKLIGEIAEALRTPVRVSEELDARVMARVHAMPRHQRLGLWSRLREPRTVTIRPVRWALLAASLIAVIALDLVTHARSIKDGMETRAAATQPAVKKRQVQFVIVAPTAKRWPWSETSMVGTGHTRVIARSIRAAACGRSPLPFRSVTIGTPS